MDSQSGPRMDSSSSSGQSWAGSSHSQTLSSLQVPPPGAAPPFVLTWDERTGVEVADLQSEIPVQAALPPEYTEVQKPTANITYTFSPIGFNGMMILPPADAQDTRPQYYITVSLNVFMPLSHITTVYRGANEYGEKVGEFEMGILAMPSKIQMKRTKPTPLLNVLVKERGSRNNGYWLWKPQGSAQKYRLRWNYSKPVAECYTEAGQKLLAQYKYAHRLALFQPHELLVTPKGQEYFDHLLMSLLIIERKRLIPAAAIPKELFN